MEILTCDQTWTALWLPIIFVEALAVGLILDAWGRRTRDDSTPQSAPKR